MFECEILIFWFDFCVIYLLMIFQLGSSGIMRHRIDEKFSRSAQQLIDNQKGTRREPPSLPPRKREHTVIAVNIEPFRHDSHGNTQSKHRTRHHLGRFGCDSNFVRIVRMHRVYRSTIIDVLCVAVLRHFSAPIVSSAMHRFSFAPKTSGRIERCHSILCAFPEQTFDSSRVDLSYLFWPKKSERERERLWVKVMGFS